MSMRFSFCQEVSWAAATLVLDLSIMMFAHVRNVVLPSLGLKVGTQSAFPVMELALILYMSLMACLV